MIQPRFLSAVVCAIVLSGCSASAQQRSATATAAHGNSEGTLEITNVSPGSWSVRTSYRQIDIRVLDMDGRPHIGLRPVSFEGKYQPYEPPVKVFFEANPGKDNERRYALRQDGEWQVTTEPVKERGAFEAAVLLDEGDHFHRLKFAFPGTGR